MNKNESLRPHFASDNYSGICPEAWASLAEANTGFDLSYGEDKWTAKAAELIRELFETDCEVYFVFNGTSANSLALASLCQSYHSIICSETAHIETDECGAPEFFSNGTKLLTVRHNSGKIVAGEIERIARRRTDIHFPKPKVVSITQATELGTVYAPDEIGEVGLLAKSLQLKVHMDGARFANAVAALGVAPKELTWRAGVDVLCFGGTKNGMSAGEAVVFFDRELAREFDYRCKQAGQLASKMRFLSAQWVGMLKEGAWLRNAQHANAMAELLGTLLSRLPGVNALYPRQANSLFVEIPLRAREMMRKSGWHFYDFIGDASRLMCSWATTEEDVRSFAADLQSALEKSQARSKPERA